MLASTVLYLLANAIGLLLAELLLDGFHIDWISFVTTVVVFTLIEVIASPLLTKMSLKNMPSLAGGVALVTTFVGLWLTSILLDGFEIGGFTNLLLATLIVWIGTVIAGIVLPMFLFKQYLEEHKR